MTSDFDLQQELESELDSGEKIVWQAQAKPRLMVARAILPILFGIPVLGVFFSTAFLGDHGHNGEEGAILIPFASIVGLIFVGASLYRVFTAGKTYYLITNRRALIIMRGLSKKVFTYYPDKLQALERRERADGRGDIVIDRVSGGGWNTSYRSNTYLQEVGFMNISEVKMVEGMLRALARKEPNLRV